MALRSVARGLAIACGAVLLGAAGGTLPASAAVSEMEHFRESGTELVDECGYEDLVHSFDFNGSYRVVQRGPNGPTVFSSVSRWRSTFTNAEGATLTVQGTLLDKDLRVIENEDGTTTLIVLLTGGFQARGPRGVLTADPGQVRLALTFDGDGNEIDRQVVKESTGRTDEGSFCADMHAAFGAAS